MGNGVNESESESKAIKTVVVGWKGDAYVFTGRAQELWRERWLARDHLPARPTSSAPTKSFVGSWRTRGA
jgi:hypothetical protein